MNMHDILRQDPEIWDLFTRKEEYTHPLRDCFDRFPYYASRNRDIFEPRASLYLIDHGYSVDYPDGAPFAVCLTHDIDSIYQSILAKGMNIYRSFKKRTFQAYCVIPDRYAHARYRSVIHTDHGSRRKIWCKEHVLFHGRDSGGV
jgi:hypothetical protein